jgi:hypothetical protein
MDDRGDKYSEQETEQRREAALKRMLSAPLSMATEPASIPKQKPRNIVRGFVHRELCDQTAASALRLRCHQPSRPPHASIIPGRPAPATGPGTALTSPD